MIGALKAMTPQPVKTAIRRATRWIPRRPRPAILMYHRIARESFDPWGLAVEEQRFAAQLEWLERNRTVLPLGEFARLHRERRLHSDAVAITFDDGYRSPLRVAVPLLERLCLHATVFLPAELIVRGSQFWWDELAQIVLGFDGNILRLEGSELKIPPKDECDRSWRPDTPPDTPRQVVFYRIWSGLRAKQPAMIESVMAELRNQAPHAPDGDRPISTDEVRSITSAAVDFGSHALTHPSLPMLDEADQRREIEASRPLCASLTGRTPTAFAYPYGDFDERTERLVRGAGFECACSAEHAF